LLDVINKSLIVQRSIPYISQEKIDEYIDEFSKNSCENGFLLFINIINFNMFSFLYGLDKRISLINNFLTYLEQECNSIKKHKIITLSLGSYIVILPNINLELVINLSSALNKYLNLKTFNDTEFALNCRILSIEYPTYSKDAKKLLEKLFLYYSSNYCNYFTEYKENNIEEIQSNSQKFSLLKKAILEEKIIFAYQPIISCKDGNVEYFECLMRIPDINGTYISVGSIIPIAERLGFINIIDRLVLKMAVNELHNSNITLSINISNIGIADPEFMRLLSSLLPNKELASRLIIEITETSINHEYDEINQSIKLIHDLGCKIALDDFGSGYTSFFQLMNLPIDIIKIDGTYIKNILQNNLNKIIIESLIKIANAIGAKTVAEYVENQEIADQLISLNIDYLQGDYFSPAIHKILKASNI
jgi:EAL domain-containing protein (putative c-di-GMP-specific phosphodiesterase class I)